MCLKYILVGFAPSITLFFPLPLLKTISIGFILLFSYMDTKNIHHIHPHSLLPVPTPSIGTHLQKRFIFPSCPSFFLMKCILIVQGDFALALQVCAAIYRGVGGAKETTQMRSGSQRPAAEGSITPCGTEKERDTGAQ
jgi:hypothetical protein